MTAKVKRKEEVVASGVSVDVAVATVVLLSVVNFVLKEEQGTTLEAVFTFTFDWRISVHHMRQW